MLDLEKYVPTKNNYFEAKCGDAKSWGEELVFEKFLSVEFIVTQIFTQIEFSCVFLTSQIFMSNLFHLTFGDPKPHLLKNPSMAFPHQEN